MNSSDFSIASQEYIVTCVSNGDKNFQLTNASNYFINVLSAPLEFFEAEYECALVQLIFADSYSPVNPTPDIKPVVPIITPTFFGEGKDHNLCIVNKTSGYLATSKKSVSGIKDFIPSNVLGFASAIYQFVSKTKFPFRFSTLLVEGESNRRRGRIQLDESTFKQPTLEISQNFADIFGFQKLDFEIGVSVAKNFVSEEAYQRLPDDERITFTLSHWEKKSLFIPEPEQYNVHSLVDTLDKLLEDHSVRIFIIDNILHVFLDTKDIKLKLPTQINSFLLLDKDFEFELPHTEIYIFSDIIPDIIPDPQKKPTQYIENFGFVLTNIISPQNTGSRMLPVLRIFPRQNASEINSNIIFSPALYLPVKESRIEAVQLKLVNSDLVEIPSSSCATVAVLHLVVWLGNLI